MYYVRVMHACLCVCVCVSVHALLMSIPDRIESGFWMLRGRERERANNGVQLLETLFSENIILHMKDGLVGQETLLHMHVVSSGL